MVGSQFSQALDAIATFKHRHQPAGGMLVRQFHDGFHDPGITFGGNVDIGHVVVRMAVKAGGDDDELRLKPIECRQQITLDQFFISVVSLAGQYR